jgi:hypothetical protein
MVQAPVLAATWWLCGSSMRLTVSPNSTTVVEVKRLIGGFDRATVRQPDPAP